VERKDTVIVASSAVMRRVRMRAEPESERAAEGLTTEDTERTEVDCRKGERRKTEHMPAGAGWEPSNRAVAR
jgi:hypothetical protein